MMKYFNFLVRVVVSCLLWTLLTSMTTYAADGDSDQTVSILSAIGVIFPAFLVFLKVIIRIYPNDRASIVIDFLEKISNLFFVPNRSERRVLADVKDVLIKSDKDVSYPKIQRALESSSKLRRKGMSTV